MTSATEQLARRLRVHVVRMTHRARASHVGSCLSIADVIAVLYGEILRVNPVCPDWNDRDRFILSKGHAGAIVYAALAERGFFPQEWLDQYCEDGAPLGGHLTRDGVPGVDFSTGSLGHGLSLGCGAAMAARADGSGRRTFVVLSDGECDEGASWEAILFAGHHRLDNLIAIVDYNKIQSFGAVREVLDLEPLAEKWRACGWSVQEIDGHSHAHLRRALTMVPWDRERPSAVIAHTTKGKGVSFMEDKLLWHYRSPDDAQVKAALAELEAAT
jgi:transketolase